MNTTEQVNHPQHYNGRSDGVECIDIIRHYVYDIGAAIKYLWRAGLKHSAGKDDRDKEIEDLRKALWYIEDYRKAVNPCWTCCDSRMRDYFETATGYRLNDISDPYQDKLGDAMECLLSVGLIYQGTVYSRESSNLCLDAAAVSIKARIAELSKGNDEQSTMMKDLEEEKEVTDEDIA